MSKDGGLPGFYKEMFDETHYNKKERMFKSKKVQEPLPTELSSEDIQTVRQFLVRQIKECQEDDHENIATVTRCIQALRDLDYLRN